MAESMVWTDRILCIHLSTHGGACFHFGNTVNSDATHIHVQVLCGCSLMLDHMVSSTLVRQGTAGLFAEEAAPFSIPANCEKG